MADLPRMRTLQQAVNEIKKVDPGTGVTYCALRNAVIKGLIPHVNVGSKRLVNMDDIYKYYANGKIEEQISPAGLHGIRRII